MPEEVHAWQNRPLAAVYPIVYPDALAVKIRDEGSAESDGSCATVLPLRDCQAGDHRRRIAIITAIKKQRFLTTHHFCPCRPFGGKLSR